ncbi:MAG: hypothetical protein AB1345_11090 [Chloroflexota bacterium]
MKNKIIGWILFAIGLIVFLVSILADLIGIGTDPTIIGWAQLTGAAVGVAVVIVGNRIIVRSGKKQ